MWSYRHSGISELSAQAVSEGYGACVYSGQLGNHRKKYCAYQVGTYKPTNSG